MAATIVRHRTRCDRLRAEQAEELRRLVVAFPALPGHAKAALVAAIDREAASEARWTFVMLSPTQNRIVVSWLLEHSSRPRKAVELWILLFEHLHHDTGEIALIPTALIGDQFRP